MSEVAALNAAWAKYAGNINIPHTVEWTNGYQTWSYASKYIFDKGWQAAMQYLDGKDA